MISKILISVHASMMDFINKQSYIGQAVQLTLEQGSENANRVFDTYKYKSTFDSVEEFTI